MEYFVQHTYCERDRYFGSFLGLKRNFFRRTHIEETLVIVGVVQVKDPSFSHVWKSANQSKERKKTVTEWKISCVSIISNKRTQMRNK